MCEFSSKSVFIKGYKAAILPRSYIWGKKKKKRAIKNWPYGDMLL